MQSTIRAHKRGAGCYYLDSLGRIQFKRKKGSTASEWAYALRHRVELQ